MISLIQGFQVVKAEVITPTFLHCLLLAMLFPVLRFTASDYPFGVFKLFKE
jgi:hypothetical protein